MLAAPAVSLADTYCTRGGTPEAVNCRHTFYVSGGQWAQRTDCTNPDGSQTTTGWSDYQYGSGPSQDGYECIFMG